MNFDNHRLVGGCYPWLYIDFLKESLYKTGQINRPILPHRVCQGDDLPVLASPLHNASLSNTNSEVTKVISVTDFFYDDPTMPYVALPDHKLDQSPCCPIIAIKDGYYYCRLHPEIKNTYLESIEHHIKYKVPAAHKSELLKLSELTP